MKLVQDPSDYIKNKVEIDLYVLASKYPKPESDHGLTLIRASIINDLNSCFREKIIKDEINYIPEWGFVFQDNGIEIIINWDKVAATQIKDIDVGAIN